MSNETSQIERPDLWFREITLPGLLVLNSVEMESGCVEAISPIDAATRCDQGGSKFPDHPLALALPGRSHTDVDQFLKHVIKARVTSTAADAHAYFFGAGVVSQQQQTRHLCLLSRELELTAAHLRRVLE